MGRSKIYNKFIKVSNEERKVEEEDEEKPTQKPFVLPKRRRAVKKDEIVKIDNIIEKPEIKNDKVILTFD